MTWKETGVNNATIHNYPFTKYIAKTALYLKCNKKIYLQYVFANETAARDYLQRQGLEGLPVRVFTHGGG